MPVLWAGILNMLFTKTTLYKKYKTPIDKGYKLNNKRLLGENKTWIGFVSMLIISGFTHILWGFILKIFKADSKSDYYSVHKNKMGYNAKVGITNGFIYMISELPNSFIKRRLDIKPGKTTKGVKGIIFYIIDQIDSLIGIALVIKKLSNISKKDTIGYIGFGGFIHIVTNAILYRLKVRNNI